MNDRRRHIGTSAGIHTLHLAPLVLLFAMGTLALQAAGLAECKRIAGAVERSAHHLFGHRVGFPLKTVARLIDSQG